MKIIDNFMWERPEMIWLFKMLQVYNNMMMEHLMLSCGGHSLKIKLCKDILKSDECYHYE